MSHLVEPDWDCVLTLEGDAGRFVGEATEEWAQGRAVFGGLVAALMMRAVERVVPEDRPPRSALIDFVAPLAAGPFEVLASPLRAGRALTHAEARIVQGGQVTATLTCACGAARQTALGLEGPQPPDVGPVDGLFQAPHLEGLSPRFTRYFDFRMRPDTIPFIGSNRGGMGGYVRHAGAGPVDAAGILTLLDAWPPAVFPLMKLPAPASTVTWMIDFYGDAPAVGTRSAEFYRYEADAIFASGGYASTEARMWSPSGQLLVASRQTIAEFSKPV